jgi:hypothetical protein
MPLNGKTFFNYITKHWNKEVAEWKASITKLEDLKEKIGEENFKFIEKITHPLNDLLIEEQVLRDNLRFFSWVLKNYPLTVEQRKLFSKRKTLTKKQLDNVGRLLKYLKEKWTK